MMECNNLFQDLSLCELDIINICYGFIHIIIPLLDIYVKVSMNIPQFLCYRCQHWWLRHTNWRLGLVDISPLLHDRFLFFHSLSCTSCPFTNLTPRANATMSMSTLLLHNSQEAFTLESSAQGNAPLHMA